MKIDERFLDKTIAYWQPFYEQSLTREDAREIIQNACDLFDLLNELRKETSCQHQTLTANS